MSRKLALLISNDQYSDPTLTRLAAPVADAEALAAVLRDPTIGMFDEVNLLLNQPAADIRHAIVEFFAHKQPTDLLLLYFSGHGLLDERSRLYLAAHDSDPKLPRSRSISAADIAQEMDDSRSKAQVLILDCCHSGAFRQGITQSAPGQPVQTGTIFNGEGRIVLAASDATQYAFEGELLVGESTRSLFTHYLVEGLATFAADHDGDGAITVDDLYLYAHDRVVADKPTQTPVKWNYHQRGAFIIAGQLRPATARATIPATNAEQPKSATHRTWVVDQMLRGDFVTINEAIEAAKPGDKILIRRGVYNEALVLDKPLELEGENGPDGVIVQVADQHTIRFSTTVGQVRNLTLRQLGGKDWDCIDIALGCLTLEYCNISSQSWSCVAIHDEANPIVRNNRIHSSKRYGIYVYAQGQGLIEKNDIFGNADSGIVIKESNPTVRNNRIHDNKRGGIYISYYGQGMIEGNDIFANATAGISIIEISQPTIRNNHIYNGKANGVAVREQGQGLIENNDILANANTGVSIGTYGNPTVRNNRINKNGYHAINVDSDGGGHFEDNDLRDNQGGAWKINDDCLPKVTRKDNIEK